jgi:hypothetical protein
MRAIDKLKFCAALAGSSVLLAAGTSAHAAQAVAAVPAAQPVAYWGHGARVGAPVLAPVYWRYGHWWNHCWGARCGWWPYHGGYWVPYAPRPVYPYPPPVAAPRAYAPPPPAGPMPAPSPAPGPAPAPGRQSLRFQPAPPPVNATSY